MLDRGTPILHVVETATKYQNAVVLRGKSADDLWDDFVGCWATIFVGYPNRIRIDQESSLIHIKEMGRPYNYVRNTATATSSGDS